jgi:hypothetical protein
MVLVGKTVLRRMRRTQTRQVRNVPENISCLICVAILTKSRLEKPIILK